ncbi:hypothetical protein PACTADRAFT_4747 [Pachysolen tannophilus NRRL Y-2460]|uniref:Uncharacterized protein n=1 Tax=Pachysolen tannophilus NRRL Y-2460 TaxID=669874 RepID=A0A1E4TQ23_PACTA|nr:hypothetical protein PACTADRAFT_4747 [Pachysolen tannophilus NRRL Y-2460]
MSSSPVVQEVVDNTDISTITSENFNEGSENATANSSSKSLQHFVSLNSTVAPSPLSLQFLNNSFSNNSSSSNNNNNNNSNNNNSNNNNNNNNSNNSNINITSSTAASIASSDLDYQNEWTNSSLTLPISRPLSRSSTTSGMSVTAFKDGIEGKRIHRNGIPNYPHNLILNMFDNTNNNSSNRLNGSLPRSIHSNYHDQSSTDITSSSFFEDDNSNPKSPSHYTNSSIETEMNNPPNIPSGPPVTLNEKMRLLKTGIVQKEQLGIIEGVPSVGPVVSGKSATTGINGSEVEDEDLDTEYTKFQKEAIAADRE